MMIPTLVLTGAVLATTAAEAGGGTLSIRTLEEKPETFLNSRVTVRCIFHGFDDRAAPLATEFAAGRYQNFSAWDDETPIWREDVFVHSSPIFFARFGSPVLKDLAALGKFERIDVSGIVRANYGGEPWIEVLDIRSLGETYREDALRAVRASEILRAKQMFSEALSWIETVKTSGLPDYVLASLHQERGFSLVASGDLRNGAKEFRRAGKLDPARGQRMEALASRATMLQEQDRPWSLPRSLMMAEKPASSPAEPSAREGGNAGGRETGAKARRGNKARAPRAGAMRPRRHPARAGGGPPEGESPSATTPKASSRGERPSPQAAGGGSPADGDATVPSGPGSGSF